MNLSDSYTRPHQALESDPDEFYREERKGKVSSDKDNGKNADQDDPLSHPFNSEISAKVCVAKPALAC